MGKNNHDVSMIHQHDDIEHVHDDQPSSRQFTPQPVPMGITAGNIIMSDGSLRIMVTYTSVNGSWTVFYDKEGAIAHAQVLLGYAYTPDIDTAPNVLLEKPEEIDEVE